MDPSIVCPPLGRVKARWKQRHGGKKRGRGRATSQLRIFGAYVALIGGVARMDRRGGEGREGGVRVNYEQPIILRLKLITRSAEDKSMPWRVDALDGGAEDGEKGRPVYLFVTIGGPGPGPDDDPSHRAGNYYVLVINHTSRRQWLDVCIFDATRIHWPPLEID